MLILVVVSVLLALWSLRGLRDVSESQEAKKELFRGKVIYQNDPTSSS